MLCLILLIGACRAQDLSIRWARWEPAIYPFHIEAWIAN